MTVPRSITMNKSLSIRLYPNTVHCITDTDPLLG